MEKINTVNFDVDYKSIKKRFNEFAKIGDVYYPLKTNSNIEIIKFLNTQMKNDNHGFLISHLSHFNKLKELGINPKRLCLINVILEDELVKSLYDSGVRYFTFDNMASLNAFLKYAAIKEVRVSVRLSINEVFNEFSHLGGTVDECQKMLEKLDNVGCKDFGLSFYLQKEVVLKTDALEIMLNFIVSNFKKYKMYYINIGGSKRPKEINLKMLKEVKKQLNIDKVILEPGRYLVGEFIDMETKIIKTKEVSNQQVIIIKNGIYGGLVDALLYHKRFDIRLKVNNKEIKLTNEKIKDSDYEIFICGASSDSGDRIGNYYINKKYKDDLNKGAILLVKNAGAYVEEFFMPLGGDLIKNYRSVK